MESLFLLQEYHGYSLAYIIMAEGALS